MASRIPNRTKRTVPPPEPADETNDERLDQDEGAESEALAPVDVVEHELEPISARSMGVATASTVTRRPATDYLPSWLPQWFRNSLAELMRVTWPSRQEAVNLTLLVIAIALAFAVVFGLVDLGLTDLLSKISAKFVN